MSLKPPGVVQLSQAVSYPTRLRWGQALDIYRSKKQKKADKPYWAPSNVDLFIDFVNNRAFDGRQKKASDLVTDTHAQSILVPDGLGGWTPKAANVPAIGPSGLQTIPTRANSIRNNSMAGVVVGSPGALPNNWGTDFPGLTRTIIGAGTENGLPYVDIRINGTSSNTYGSLAFESTSIIAATVGQLWAESVGVKLIGGSLVNIGNIVLTLQEWNNSPAFVANNNSVNKLSQVNSNFITLTNVFTVAQATAATIRPCLNFTWASGIAIDFTLRLYAPQLELGAFATAPILTTVGALSRNGNQQNISGLGSKLVTGVAGYIKFDSKVIEALVGNTVLSFNDGTVNNRIKLEYSSSGQLRWAHRIGGGATSTGSSLASIPVAPYGKMIVAFTFSNGFQALQRVGGSQISNTLAWPVMDRLAIGGLGHDASGNVYQLAEKLALEYLTAADNPATKFDQMFALAQAA